MGEVSNPVILKKLKLIQFSKALSIEFTLAFLLLVISVDNNESISLNIFFIFISPYNINFIFWKPGELKVIFFE